MLPRATNGTLPVTGLGPTSMSSFDDSAAVNVGPFSAKVVIVCTTSDAHIVTGNGVTADTSDMYLPGSMGWIFLEINHGDEVSVIAPSGYSGEVYVAEAT